MFLLYFTFYYETEIYYIGFNLLYFICIRGGGHKTYDDDSLKVTWGTWYLNKKKVTKTDMGGRGPPNKCDVIYEQSL